MPKLWKDTVENHRRDVRAAILNAAWQLAAERGVLGVTMGQVAEVAGIGRATLYKYFSGVEDILIAAHGERVEAHLSQMEAIRSSAGAPGTALRQVMAGYARIRFHQGRSAAPDLQGLVHSGEQHRHREQRLVEMFAGILGEAQAADEVRSDVKAEELAAYCLNALAAASRLPSQAAVDRLLDVVTSGLHAKAR